MTQTYEAWRITYQSSEQAARAAFERMMELEQGKCLHQIAEPAAVHPDDVAVDALAALMKAKLAKQRGKGYSGWDTDCTQEHLSNLLRSHVNKGDPVDVANFCAFLAARGEMICLTDAELINAMETRRAAEPQRLLAVTQPAPQAVQPAIMPKGESAAAQLRAMATNYPAGHNWDKLDARACIRGALEIEALRALLAAAPAHPAEGVPAQVHSALADARAVLLSINRGDSQRIKVGDDVCYWQRDEWVQWAIKEVLPLVEAALAATQPAAQGMDADLTDEQIDEAFNQMPDGAAGFLKSWGYRQFARAVLAAQAKQGGA